ncbi:MAG: transcriptional regulator [Bdellovibrionaceae bacterium]|jgi:DNA-binding FrmR family transcriptional regulator|nr:transcriptional regulator [Pseudobdellovibrionaceae bacterium]MDP7320932.1 metal-sensitive transcriptional regulator [Bacteriovoracaceae bacterium]|tara:strand:- start:12900 stop:13193 length:294 start_codon:yes stop_codon:yes gene_type:complete
MKDSHKHGADHKNQLTRVNKIEGQVRGIKKMIEDEKYCVDILTQIKAARSALKSLELSVLEGHLNCCLISAIDSNSKKDALEKVDEILNLLKRTSKS